jgi:PEP-CTERM motif-containing protein
VTLNGLALSSYITNADYVSGTDTLYVWDANNLYEATGVAEALGISGAVPEPSTWAMMLLGFAGLGYMGFYHRKRMIAA